MKDFLELVWLGAVGLFAGMFAALLTLLIVAAYMIAIASPIILIVWIIMHSKL